MRSHQTLTMAYQGNSPAPHPTHLPESTLFSPLPPLNGTPTNPHICRPAVPATPSAQQHQHALRLPALTMPALGSPSWPGVAPGRQHREELRAPRRSAPRRAPAAPRPLRAPGTAAPPQRRAMCDHPLPPPRGTFVPSPGYFCPQLCAFPPRPVRVCARALPLTPLPCRAPRAAPQPVVALEGLISQQ